MSKPGQKLPVGVDHKAPLSELYAPTMINRIVGGLETADRWGVRKANFTCSKIINSQIINRIVRQYIDDEISSSDAVAKMNAELASIE